MIVTFRKHLPGCPGEFLEPVNIGVCKADVYGDYLRLRCFIKETVVTHDFMGEGEEDIDSKTAFLLSKGDLIKCGNDIVLLSSKEQMLKLADSINADLPPLEKFYPQRFDNTPQYDSDTDLFDF